MKFFKNKTVALLNVFLTIQLFALYLTFRDVQEATVFELVNVSIYLAVSVVYAWAAVDNWEEW